jgi:hypothetical protein
MSIAHLIPPWPPVGVIYMRPEIVAHLRRPGVEIARMAFPNRLTVSRSSCFCRKSAGINFFL